MTDKINIKKQVYESKRARDVLDEEFNEFLPSKRNTQEFFTTYYRQNYNLKSETHTYFTNQSLDYIKHYTHPKQIILNNLIEESEVIRRDILSIERFHPIVPNGIVVGYPKNPSDAPANATWEPLTDAYLYYVQTGRLREITGTDQRVEFLYKKIKAFHRSLDIADNRFVIKLSDEIINSMVLTKPLKSELDLSDSIYDLNTYNGILPDGIIN